jgi:hypothetical protein
MAMAAKPTAGDTPWTTVGNQIYDSVQAPVANLYQNSAQSLLNNTETAITLDLEASDTHNGHDLVTNNSRWTCPVGWDGYYLFSGVVFFCWLRSNGVNPMPGSVNRRGPFSGADGDGMPTPACLIQMAAGDYIEVVGLHTQGTAVNTLATAQYRSGLNVAFQRF